MTNSLVHLLAHKAEVFGLKGQNISAQGNALGKETKWETVRERKMIKTKNFPRMELHLLNPYKTRIHPFRPKLLLLFETQHYADDFNPLQLTPGNARVYYNLSLSGKRKVLIIPNFIELLKIRQTSS